MKKQYSKPLTEEVTFSLETFIAASNPVSGTQGLDDLTISSERPYNFAKGNDSLWDFDDED